MLLFWAIVTGACVVLELATYGLTSIWFALGGLCALLAAALGAPLWLQAVWFAIISGATLLLTRPLAIKYVNSRAQPTNADRVIGTEALVRETVDNLAETGTIFTDGKLWTARSVGGEPIPAGARVVIREIRGVTLLVSPMGPGSPDGMHEQ